MNKEVRRKWAFEKGRDSRSVFFAAVVVLLTVTFVLGGFSYEYRFFYDKSQEVVMSVISSADSEFLEMLDRRDPAMIYGINGGGFGELMAERSFSVGGTVDEMPEIPDFQQDLKTVPMPTQKLPAVNAAEVLLPGGGAQRSLPDLRPKVIMPDGSIEIIPQLSEINGVAPAAECMIRIYGDGVLMNSEIIRSCGNTVFDRHAEICLKSFGLPQGIYVVNWAGKGAKI